MTELPKFSKRASMLLASAFLLAITLSLAVVPSASADLAQLYPMSTWDSGDWKLGVDAITTTILNVEYRTPTTVYFQSAQFPYATTAGIEESQSASYDKYCNTQVVHDTTTNGYSILVHWYTPTATNVNPFCDFTHPYHLSRVIVWAYQYNQSGIHWLGTQEIKNPANNEYATIYADTRPSAGRLGLFVQTEFSIGGEQQLHGLVGP